MHLQGSQVSNTIFPTKRPAAEQAQMFHTHFTNNTRQLQ